MKRFAPLLITFSAVACAPQPAPQTAQGTEAELAASLPGRAAGPAQRCVNLNNLRGNRSAGERAIIFEGRGNLVYLNRLRSSCPEVDSGRALRTSKVTFRLCEGEHVEVFDPVSGLSHGSCQLGSFVPYRAVD